ncbi:hypothetical protein B0H19DRAFT_1146328 [Mycena capillaripes]|nr:hypothetical protein B0H19DRAFT_1146328 [Mycena capillaripes]
MGVENFDVFLDVDNRFLISISPQSPDYRAEFQESQILACVQCSLPKDIYIACSTGWRVSSAKSLCRFCCPDTCRSRGNG